MRRILLALLVLSSALALAACGKSDKIKNEKVDNFPYTQTFEGKLPAKFFENNSTELTLTETTVSNTATNLSDLYDQIASPVGHFVRVGKIDGDGFMRYGVYNLESKQEVIAPTNKSVTLLRRLALGALVDSDFYITYASVVDINDQTYVMSVIDKVKIVTGTDAHYFDVTLYLDDEELIVIEKIDKYEHGVLSETILNKIEITDSFQIVRSTYTEGDSVLPEYITQGELFDMAQIHESLEGYFAKPITDERIEVHKGEKYLHTIQLPNAFFIHNGQTLSFGKNVYFQIISPADSETEYDLIYNGEKSNIATYGLDFTTNKKVLIKNFNYVIENYPFDYYLDDKGMETLKVLRVSPIVNKEILDLEYVLFNDKLSPVYNFRKDNPQGILKLDENLYYVNRKLYDGKMNVKLDLVDYFNVSFTNYGTISLRNHDGYGVIDYEGKILVPFKYALPFTYTNDVAINIDNETFEMVFIKKDNTELLRVGEHDNTQHLGMIMSTDGYLRTHDYKTILSLNPGDSVGNLMEVKNAQNHLIGYWFRINFNEVYFVKVTQVK